ncbi:hypothetical protein [Nocardiopsis metallicus]|uniref:Uncharacterized protein n=1 Tax=Nocardiopsis metallicus TaxID=179819 RepID=A0A840WHY3_9ACTN|nr:hypothetical protein [Nocardiopsis metallicus]MBB5492611.1 hypothetical protein [Nocardiopsis metallicus]
MRSLRPVQSLVAPSALVLVGTGALLEGVPHPFLLALLAVELVIPPVLFLWHRELNREKNRVAGDSAAG